MASFSHSARCQNYQTKLKVAEFSRKSVSMHADSGNYRECRSDRNAVWIDATNFRAHTRSQHVSFIKREKKKMVVFFSFSFRSRTAVRTIITACMSCEWSNPKSHGIVSCELVNVFFSVFIDMTLSTFVHWWVYIYL